MQAFRNYGSIREAPGSSSGAQAPIPSISLHEEPTIGSVQNDDGYFGIEGLQDHQPEELARVSYAQLIRSYSLVPICSLLFLILMALIPTLWEGPMQKGRSPSVFNMMVAFAAWVISYGFKTPSHNLATGFGRWVTDTSVALGVLISTILQEATRLFGLVISSLTFALDVNNGNQSLPLNTDSPLFRQVWWYALGWAAGIELYGIAQGYFQLVAYKDVLEEDAPSDEESDLMGETMTTRSEGRRYISSVLKSPPEENNPEQNTQAALTRLSVAFPSTGTPMSAYLDEEMARLLAIRTRAELEQVYGIPPPNIPVFVSCLQRLDSILYAFGLTLILSHRYLTELISTQQRTIPDGSPITFDHAAAIAAIFPTFFVLVSLTSAVNTMWALALPSIGVHSASYAALLLALGLFFIGLGYWDAL